MANIIFLSRRTAERATITASSEQTLLTATNLIGPTPSKVWRSASLSGVYILVDFGAATAIDTLAMVRTNWTGAATWRLRLATSEANTTAAPGYDGTAVSTWPVTGKPTEDWLQHAPLMRLPSTQTYRWARIDIADAANTDGYLEAGALLIGLAVTTTYNFSPGWSFGDEPNGIVSYSGYGPTLVDDRDDARVKSIPFKVLPRGDAMAGLGAMIRERKTTRPFLVCVDPSQTTYLHVATIYGLRVGPWSVDQPFYELFGTALKIKELL